MRVRGIINRRSGLCIGRGAEPFAAALSEPFGDDCHLICVEPEEVEATLDRALAEKPHVVVAGGGDGTVRSAARALIGTETALAAIPLGTINRFARDLGAPLEPIAAARATAKGTATRIDVAEINGEIFLCNSVLGLPPRFSMRRQELRGLGFAQRMHGYFAALREFIASTHKVDIDIDDGQQCRRVRALSVIVSNNLYGEDVGPAVLRRSLSDGVLGLYIARHKSGGALLWAFVRAMLGRWKSDPHLEFGKAAHLRIGTPRERVPVANDGEVVWVTAPLDYRIRPGALSVVIPSGGRLRLASSHAPESPADIPHFTT